MAANPFKKAKTIAEVYAVARTLRESGMDNAKVNAMVSERKAELLKVSEKVSLLQKIHPAPLPLQGPQVSSLTFQVKDLSACNIVVSGEGSITI